MLYFTNPRLFAEFPDWPLGGNKRGNCVFQVHTDPKKGTRVSRTTTGKPKFTTYSEKAAIVDGSDGKTYILSKSRHLNMVMIQRSDFMSAEPAAIFGDSALAAYANAMALIDAAQ